MSIEQPVADVMPEGQAPPTYLGLAIAATAFCFLPCGLASAYFGWESLRAWRHGDDAWAVRCSKAARRWLVAAIVTGVLVDLVIAASLGLLGAFPSSGAQ